MHKTNPVSPAASRGFDQQRIAQTLRMLEGIRDGFDRPTAPGRNGDLRLFREVFGGDLVAELTHHFTAGADEDNPHLAAEICEGSVLRHEPPSDPSGIGARRGQNLFETPVVKVGALAAQSISIHKVRGTERECLVGFANEHGVAIGLCIERDGSQRPAVFVTKFAGGADKAHRRFPAIHNRNPLKFTWH
jgi:hypothetical protein